MILEQELKLCDGAGDSGTAAGRPCPLCGSGRTRAVYAREMLGVKWHLFACGACHLRYTVPCPTAAQMGALYAGDYHEGLRSAGAAEHEFGEKYRRYLRMIQRHC